MRNLLFLSILCSILVACNGNAKEQNSSNAPTLESTQVNDLPKIDITLINDEKIQMSELKGKVLLVMFFPDCDHCQQEAIAMQENLKAFDHYTVYYLSSNPKEEVMKFAADYKLAGKPNIKFGMVSGESVVENFGPIPTPSMYIYNDGRLMKSFEGQTDIQVIIGAL